MNNKIRLINRKYLTNIIVLLINAIFLSSLNTHAFDTVKMTREGKPNSLKALYKKDIIINALEFTRKEYGNYKITSLAKRSSNKRAILEIKSGKNINTYLAVTTKEWEDNTLPIRIPIRRGILNYRLLTINKNHAERFEQIRSLSDLKQLRIGLRTGWSSIPIFKEQGFNVVESSTFNGLFYMLQTDRIDYIPRGINEAQVEIDSWIETIPNLIIEPNYAIKLVSPYYIFISPKEPRLAKRLTLGLGRMHSNGTLKRLFDQYYTDIIKEASIESRTVFPVENNFLPKKTPININDFWFYNDKNKTITDN